MEKLTIPRILNEPYIKQNCLYEKHKIFNLVKANFKKVSEVDRGTRRAGQEDKRKKNGTIIIYQLNVYIFFTNNRTQMIQASARQLNTV